jgi:transcriptional regulator with XRE-family HTH domain
MGWERGLITFGEYLYEAIKRKGVSLREFAPRLGVTHSMLSQIKSGQVRVPPERHEQWADALELQGDEREFFLDLAALSCAPPRVLAMFNSKHPAFQTIMLAQMHGALLREVAELKQRVAENGDAYEGPPSKRAKPGPRP